MSLPLAFNTSTSERKIVGRAFFATVPSTRSRVVARAEVAMLRTPAALPDATVTLHKHENAHNNGWTHSVSVTGVLCFGIDGTISWPKDNCSGS
ncbi:hypothetical protein SPRG_02901 [Saprolegnia parasitica CBS 223.65]|uniref:Uncharacterized protein n=1 Tax=Saprolegnia parasitica (strain CBS 223.65) TaxID=695850 RepID=A0A067CNY6_SAPPC|nr:hypothetical protein SPRG_02901 [Saprolegnia parasitica CBS 223.65]KDO32424.1 hypothetical protein SPRG_02901 [Saprolegnia parasitica CBS 223.65]|eukprot:XP_012196878.1 hypothetical protein SPRG_02901 [Saprolegnia parasitica CBS 223.65]